MSDDLEDVSVVETVETTPSAEPVPVPVDIPVETSSEPVHADEQVFTPSTKIGTAEDAIRQQVAAENGAIHGNGDVDGRTLTEASRQAKAAAAEEDRERKFEAIKQSESLRKEKEDNFGMSSHDLTKLIDFISNPDLKKKLEERLTSSIGEKKAKKAMAELDEFNQLKKKQDSGQPLTDLEKARMAELRKSEDLKVAIQTAQEIRNEAELRVGSNYSADEGKKISSTFKTEEKGSAGVRATASFESNAPSGIEASPITTAYNVAASNKNEAKTPELIVAQANVIANRSVEVAGAGFTV